VWYPGLPAPIPGVEAFKELLARIHAGLPDAEWEFGDLVAEGEVVVARDTGPGRGELSALTGICDHEEAYEWTSGSTTSRVSYSRATS
jgi:hypothetical protein